MSDAGRGFVTCREDGLVVQGLAVREAVTLDAGQPLSALVGVYWTSSFMVPVQEVAVHIWFCMDAPPTVILIVRVSRMGILEGPHVKMEGCAVPVYTAPARVKVTVTRVVIQFPETATAHAPLVHCGANFHVSVAVLPTAGGGSVLVRTLLSTYHEPCRRASEIGGVGVLTTRTEDGAERWLPDTATTRYWYPVAGTSPRSW